MGSCWRRINVSFLFCLFVFFVFSRISSAWVSSAEEVYFTDKLYNDSYL